MVAVVVGVVAECLVELMVVVVSRKGKSTCPSKLRGGITYQWEILERLNRRLGRYSASIRSVIAVIRVAM